MATTRTTEKVHGSRLREGDLIWRSGYLWRILKVERQTWDGPPAVDRYHCTCGWSGQGPEPPVAYRDDFGTAQRVDLLWDRDVGRDGPGPAQAGAHSPGRP